MGKNVSRYASTKVEFYQDARFTVIDDGPGVGKFYIVAVNRGPNFNVDTIIAGPYMTEGKADRRKCFYDKYPWLYWFTRKSQSVWAWIAGAVGFTMNISVSVIF